MATSDEHALDPSEVRDRWWLQAASPMLREADWHSDHIGKWCIVRAHTEIDAAWAIVCSAIAADRLQLAKCSTVVDARMYGGTHVICVYSPESHNREAVMGVRAVLRDLGFFEEIGYKTDQATRDGVYGGPDEWLYRA